MLNQSPLKSFWSQLNVVGGEDCRKETGVFLLDQIWGEGSFLAPWGGWKIAMKGSSGSLSKGCGMKGEGATSWSCTTTKLEGFCCARLRA